MSEEKPKKTKLEKNMEDIFNLQPEEPKPIEGEIVPFEEQIDDAKEKVIQLFKKASGITKDFDNDSQLAAQNIRDIINSGNDILEHLTRLAIQSESARGYEVLANLMRTMVECNERLIMLHSKVQKIEANESKPGRKTPEEMESGKTINNTAIFVGTPNDLSEKYKDRFLNRRDE